MGALPDRQDKMVVVGQFAGPHGVRGEFKLRSYTEDPSSIARYGPLTTQSGDILTPNLVREVKDGVFVARAPEITSREGCERFKGALLHVPRSVLPVPDEDEFYLDDLVGLLAFNADGHPVGTVKAVVNFGAGDVVELINVPDRAGTVLIPFTKEIVPKLDIAGGKMTVLLPQEDAGGEPYEGDDDRANDAP
ncbi:MAG: ribosome maturation factor RimM [Pseudomonadota bacterium]